MNIFWYYKCTTNTSNY